MKCSLCDEEAEFKCACPDPYMCSAHLGIHLKSNKNHEYEIFDIEYKDTQLSQLRSNILQNIQTIVKSKKDMASNTKSLINHIQNLFKQASGHLESIIQTYFEIIKRSKFCGSELKTLNEIETMTLTVPTIILDEIRNSVQRIYSQESKYYNETKQDWETQFLNQHTGGFWCGDLGLDNSILVTGGYDSTIRVWDLTDQVQKFILLGHSGAVKCLELIKKDKFIISGSNDASVRIWNFKHENQTAVLKGHKGAIFSICFLENKSQIISSDFYFEIIIWDFVKHIALKKHRVSAAIRCLELIQEESFLIAGVGRNIVVYGIEEFNKVKIMEGHSNFVSCLAFSVDEEFMVSGSFDQLIIVWEIPGYSEIFRLKGHSGSVQSLSLTLNDQFLVSGSDDMSVRVWDLKTASQLCVLNKHASFVRCVLRCDQIFLSLSEDSSIGYINIESMSLQIKWFLKPFKYNSLVYIPESKIIGYGSNNEVSLWNIEKEAEEKNSFEHQFYIQYVEVSKDGNFAISCSLGEEKNLFYWNLAKNRKVFELKGHKNSVFCASLASDGIRGASGSMDKTVRTWNLKKGKQEIEFRGHNGNVNSIKFIDNENLLVSAGQDKKIIVWNLSDKTQYATFDGLCHMIWKLIVTQDEKFIISCDYFEGIRIWNIENKQQELNFSFKEQAENWLVNNQVPFESVKEFLKA